MTMETEKPSKRNLKDQNIFLPSAAQIQDINRQGGSFPEWKIYFIYI
jgi:hypothetical protein